MENLIFYVTNRLFAIRHCLTSFMNSQKKSQPSFWNVSLSLQVCRSRCPIFVQKYLVFQNNQKMFCCFYYVKMKTSNQCLKVSNIEMRGCNMALIAKLCISIIPKSIANKNKIEWKHHKTKVKYYYREAKYGYCKSFVATKRYKRSLKSYKCCIGFLLPHIICKESQLLSLEIVVFVLLGVQIQQGRYDL